MEWDIQILYLGNGTQKEFKACVAQRYNFRKDTEDILTDPAYRVRIPYKQSSLLPEVQNILAMNFIAHSAPDIRHKIQKTTADPQTPDEWFLPIDAHVGVLFLTVQYSGYLGHHVVEITGSKHNQYVEVAWLDKR